MSSGDPRFSFLLAWMAGSTYGITGTQAFFYVGSALILVPLTVLTHRWIGLLSLGEVMSREAGIAIGRARGTILLLSAGLTAASILLIGPLSFVGLIGPHLATAIGLRRPLHHLLGGMLLGGLVMIAADWLGRNLLFPYQIPAGLLAALVGGPYFLLMQWGVRR
jgi:iron complex transport system permease protein